MTLLGVFWVCFKVFLFFSSSVSQHLPLAENKISDRAFADYLFLRDNPKGVFLERWRHAAGCRRWFNVVRDTVSHQIIEIYAMGSLPKSKAGKQAYNASWRRSTAAEAAAKPAKNNKGER